MEEEKIKVLLDKYETGRLAHSFLIETNNIDLCLSDLKKFIKHINCPLKYENDCKKCNLCNLIDLDNLPSLQIIKPDGMSIKKNQLQEIQDKFSTKPVYSKYNTYIILNAETMNASSANSILKFLEEPIDNIIGFLVTSNKEKMLDTIISRCQNIKIIYDNNTVNENMDLLATEYLKQILESDIVLVNRNLILSVINTRVEIKQLFLTILNYFLRKEIVNYFPGNNSVDKYLEIYNKRVEIIKIVLKMIEQNVNIELLLDYFVLEMRNTRD